MGQGAMVALWAAAHHSEKMTGTGKEACAASAVTGRRLAGVGPESDPQESPEEARSEGEGCVRGQPAVDAALKAWVHDVSWVMTVVGLGGKKVGPESEVSVEREAFEGGGVLLAG